MQGKSRLDRELLDAGEMAGHLVPPGSVFAFLAERRRELFPDSFTADLQLARLLRHYSHAQRVRVVVPGLFQIRHPQVHEPHGDLRFSVVSGGARVFVDQAAQDGSPVDRPAVKVGDGEVAAVVFTAGDALGDPRRRPGRVVVHLVFGQHAAQMSLPEDQHAV